ncbi:MAG: DegT/DnrJ/EryC1/StrS family aminotransferase [Chthoniobacterales bacterium]
MRVPLLDLSQQYRALAPQIRQAVDDVLATQQFILGPKVEEFERAAAEYCGCRHAIGVSSGTDALLAIFMALGFGPGDAVIVPSFTFFATGSCVARVGATPLFADIDPTTYNITAATVEACLRRCGAERIRAVVPVHLFGLCCEMDPLLELANNEGLMVIEDAAQAVGAEYRTGKAGTMSAVAAFSFYPSKNLGAAGDAGLITTNDDELAERLRICRQHGMRERYFHDFIGGNFRMDAIQAAVLQSKLPHLDEWSAGRRRVADIYREEFTRRGLTGAIGLPLEPYRDSGLTNHHIYHQYVIRTARRDELRTFITERQIGTAIYYPIGLHQQRCFSYLSHEPGSLPETEAAARETLALPIYPELTRDQQGYVADAIAEFFQ